MRIRHSLFLLICFGVVLGFVWYVTSHAEPETETVSRYYLYSVDFMDISNVEVIHNGQGRRFKNTDEGWLFDDGSDLAVSMDRWGGLPGLLAEPFAKRIVSDNIDDFSTYGLESPKTTVKVGLKDDQVLSWAIGNLTPTEDSQYVKLEDSPTLYALEPNWDQILSRIVTEPPYQWAFSDEEGKRYNAAAISELEITHNDITKQYTKLSADWVLEGDQDQPVNNDILTNIVDKLFNLKVDRIQPNPEFGPLKYGFNPFQTRISASLPLNIVVDIHLGILTEDGNYQYLRVGNSNRQFLIDPSFGQDFSLLVTEPPLRTSN